MNYGAEQQGHLHTEEPISSFSGSRKGSLGGGRGGQGSTFQNVIMSDCCDGGTCLVRMVLSHTAAEPRKVGCWTHICVWGRGMHVNEPSLHPVRDTFVHFCFFSVS